jgi:hypothetical protein
MTVVKIEVIGNYGLPGEFRKTWEMKIDDTESPQTPPEDMIQIPFMVTKAALAEALKSRAEGKDGEWKCRYE